MEKFGKHTYRPGPRSRQRSRYTLTKEDLDASVVFLETDGMGKSSILLDEGWIPLNPKGPLFPRYDYDSRTRFHVLCAPDVSRERERC